MAMPIVELPLRGWESGRSRRTFHQLARRQCNKPSTTPEATPITGPISLIMILGESRRGIDFIIAASCAWCATYGSVHDADHQAVHEMPAEEPAGR